MKSIGQKDEETSHTNPGEDSDLLRAIRGQTQATCAASGRLPACHRLNRMLWTHRRRSGILIDVGMLIRPLDPEARQQ
jgi:hypothetical protein